MCKIIAISNQKGGVGKTTSTKIIAEILKHKGKRVLVLDLDPQGNLSFSLGINSDDCVTIYDVVKGLISPKKSIQRHGTVDVMASNILLSSIEVEFKGDARESLIRKCLENIKVDYDFILIDTPPSLGVLTVNAFVAADYVLIPLTPDIFSLQGVTEIYDTVDYIRKNINRKIKFLGMFLNKFSVRLKMHNEVRGVCEMISNDINIPLLNTFIRSSIAVSESQSVQKDIVDIFPLNNSVIDYMKLTDEILEVV